MSKVRINDLARELEVKSKAILDALTAVGVTEKKTHSSSLEEHEAEKVRIHLRGSSEASSPTAKSARPLRGEEEIKTKIDLSNISRPGDVLKAITQQKEAAPPPRPAAPPAIVARPVVAPPVARPTPPPAAPFTPPAVTPAPPHLVVVPPPIVERPAAPAIQCRCAAGGCSAASCSRASGSRDCAACARRAVGDCIVCAADSRARAASCAACRYWPAAAACAANDRSADWAASGVQSSAAAHRRAGRASRCARGRNHASGARTPRTRPANFPAPAPARAGRSGCAASAAASRRTPSHASHAHGSGGCASARCRTRSAASGTGSSRGSSWCAVAQARPALCSARCKRRPDEGLHAAAAHGGVE